MVLALSLASIDILFDRFCFFVISVLDFLLALWSVISCYFHVEFSKQSISLPIWNALSKTADIYNHYYSHGSDSIILMCHQVGKNSQNITLSWCYESKAREKGRNIWLSPITKAPTPAEMSKGQSDNTKNATKSSIIQRLRTDKYKTLIVTTTIFFVNFIH